MGPMKRDLQTIPDVQSTPDSRKLAIDKVGVKAIRHPIRITERAGGVQHTIATFNMYVGLPHHFKGTHMSRFVEILNAHEREISPDTFRVMLREMVAKLEADAKRQRRGPSAPVVAGRFDGRPGSSAPRGQGRPSRPAGESGPSGGRRGPGSGSSQGRGGRPSGNRSTGSDPSPPP